MNKLYSCQNFFSQIDVINVSKIQQSYCYFTENTSMDFRKVNLHATILNLAYFNPHNLQLAA